MFSPLNSNQFVSISGNNHANISIINPSIIYILYTIYRCQATSDKQSGGSQFLSLKYQVGSYCLRLGFNKKLLFKSFEYKIFSVKLCCYSKALLCEGDLPQ